MFASIREPCDESVIRSRPASAPCPKFAGRWVLVATTLASSMAFIDSTVVNVALAALQTNLNATIVDVQWVIESYALLLSALLLVGGSLGDHYGRRRVFSIGVCLFAAASLWCGLASGFTGITMAMGPVLGGWLIDHASWRWAFFLNLPLAAAVLWLARTHVPESRNPDQRGGVDWSGAALATLALGLVVYALLESSSRGWSDAMVLGALGVGIASGFAFWYVEKHAQAPMLPLSLF